MIQLPPNLKVVPNFLNGPKMFFRLIQLQLKKKLTLNLLRRKPSLKRCSQKRKRRRHSSFAAPTWNPLTICSLQTYTPCSPQVLNPFSKSTAHLNSLIRCKMSRMIKASALLTQFTVDAKTLTQESEFMQAATTVTKLSLLWWIKLSRTTTDTDLQQHMSQRCPSREWSVLPFLLPAKCLLKAQESEWQEMLLASPLVPVSTNKTALRSKIRSYLHWKLWQAN